MKLSFFEKLKSAVLAAASRIQGARRSERSDRRHATALGEHQQPKHHWQKTINNGTKYFNQPSRIYWDDWKKFQKELNKK